MIRWSQLLPSPLLLLYVSWEIEISPLSQAIIKRGESEWVYPQLPSWKAGHQMWEQKELKNAYCDAAGCCVEEREEEGEENVLLVVVFLVGKEVTADKKMRGFKRSWCSITGWVAVFIYDVYLSREHENSVKREWVREEREKKERKCWLWKATFLLSHSWRIESEKSKGKRKKITNSETFSGKKSLKGMKDFSLGERWFSREMRDHKSM